MSAFGTTRARAYSNIALIKYWGKRDESLMLPHNSSLSLTLDSHPTITDVTLDGSLNADSFYLDGALVEGKDANKVVHFLDLVRSMVGVRTNARVVSHNTGPTAAGLASSTSGFAALALAASRAYGLDLSPRELTRLARRGSGSASRSIFGGLVVWHAGTGDEDCYAEPVDSGFLDLAMVIMVLNPARKAISTRDGMRRVVETSPFYPAWVASAEEQLGLMLTAIDEGDFNTVGALTESNALRMHATTWGADPPFTYLQPESYEAIASVQALRGGGLSCWATMDAGPNVKVLCQRKELDDVVAGLRENYPDVRLLTALPGPDATVDDVEGRHYIQATIGDPS